MEQDPEKRFYHEPVLLKEVLEWLGPALGKAGLVVDCTVGGGGHAEALLELFPHIQLVGVDRDPDALRAARLRLGRFGSRARLEKANFSELWEQLEELRHESAAAILYDLGVSSFQVDQPERGFQFKGGAPLDMRMDPESNRTAADIVNNYSQKDLTAMLLANAEERFASRVAKAIVSRRQKRPFLDGGDLAEVVKQAIPAATRRSGPHPARRTFQALRIEVNDELRSLERSLSLAVDYLVTGGRLAVMSYHSLEDRIVKRSFNRYSAGCICPRDLPICRCEKQAELRVLTKKPVRPSPAEAARNPRSDSARLRVAEKLAVARVLHPGVSEDGV